MLNTWCSVQHATNTWEPLKAFLPISHLQGSARGTRRESSQSWRFTWIMMQLRAKRKSLRGLLLQADQINEFNDRAFDFIPLAAISTDDPPLGPSCCTGSNEDEVADECVDEWVEEYPFPTAGRVIRMDCTLHIKWRLLFRHEDLDGDAAMDDGALLEQQFSPFASELNWRVASWVVQGGIGHKSLDWLLAIPGVSGLFGDTRLMLISCPCSGGGAPRPILPQYVQAPSGHW